MKRGLSHKGFTIVETMIVLAVTGALFIAAAILVNGRQSKTQFEQSIRGIQSQLQLDINQIASGQFPKTGDVRCTNVANTPNLTQATTDQGTNQDCIFLGKVIQFGVRGTDPQRFTTFTVAGVRQNGTKEVESLTQANPVPVYNFSGSDPDLTTTDTLKYGLRAEQMYSLDPGHTDIGAFALVTSLKSYIGGEITSGSQKIDLVPIPGTALDQTERDVALAINAALEGTAPNPSGGVNICFVSDSTDQSGLMTIGGDGRQMTVTLSIKGNKTCS